MLSPGARGRGGHRDHDPSGLPVHAGACSGAGFSRRERALSVHARLADSRQRRAPRWNAALEVRGQPVSYFIRESPARRKALRIPHRVPGFRPRVTRAFASGKKLGRFCFRQRDPGSGPLARLPNRRSDLPGKIYARSLFNKFSQKRAIRLRLHPHRTRVPLGKNPRERAIVSRRDQPTGRERLPFAGKSCACPCRLPKKTFPDRAARPLPAPARVGDLSAAFSLATPSFSTRTSGAIR